MAKGKNDCAVVLTFSPDIENTLSRLCEEYLIYIDYKIVPHLTLIYPFTPVFSLYKVNEQLEKVAKQTKQFNITLNGINYFEDDSNVAYAAIENKRAVKKLHIDLISSLEGLIKEQYTDGKYNLDRFVPHVTIGNKIPDEIFLEIKKKLLKYRLHFEDNITDFSLFAEIKGAWQRKRVFELTG
ncbi:MAG: 2'-5' RNA ligase family protein [Dehalococcoidales bacterium]